MARNWLRRVELSIPDLGLTVRGGGSRDLRIKGAVRQWGGQTPNMASIRVQNPDPSWYAKCREGMKVTLSAGYEEGNFGPIFSGEIKQPVQGRETAVDTFLDLFCADSQLSYEAARVGSALAAGHTPQDRVDLALKAMATFGVSASLGLTNVDLSQPRAPRGAAYVGPARDLLRSVALSAGAMWSIQDGQVHVVDQRKPVPGNAITMSPRTGEIAWPRQTSDGIEVTSLINPALRPHVNITLDPSTVQLAEQNNNPFDASGAKSNAYLADQNALAGTYNIFKLDRFFDTRGPEFFDVSLCVGAGAQPPPSQAGQGYYTLGAS